MQVGIHQYGLQRRPQVEELNWTRSPFCEANGCVEIVTPHRCESGACVDVANHTDHVLIRDSKLGDASPVLSFTRAEWDAFTAGVRDGQFD
jgi:hypothetical protein